MLSTAAIIMLLALKVSTSCYIFQVTRYVSPHPVDMTPISISIIFKRQKQLGECIHLYNVLLRKIMIMLDLTQIGRQHCNPRSAYSIPQHK